MAVLLRWKIRRRALICCKTNHLNYCRENQIRKLSSWKHNVPPEVKIEFSNGPPLKLSCGQYARFADGACVAQLGDTSVLATTVSKNKSSSSFLPLTVDFRQKASAAGRIPTNFLRRELGATDREILTSRVIDRSVRPLFHEGFCYETQIICNPLAVDGVHNPDIAAINAASTALALSDIPWNGPVGAVRVGLCNNEPVLNPTRRQLMSSDLNLVITAAKQNLVVMLEGSANNILLPDFQHIIKFGVKETQNIVSTISDLQKKYGKVKRDWEPMAAANDEVFDAVRTLSEMRLREIFSDYSHDKISRDNAVSAVRNDVLEKVKVAMSEIDSYVISDCFNKISKEIFRTMIFEDNIRCDGRRMDELRDISCQTDMYKPLHGSAIFQRGQTQVFCTVALDSANSALKLDPLTALTSGLKEKNFFLHYDFPPYATNEIGRLSGGHSGRREIGHGSLAEAGLKPIIPSGYQFTIRLTSEVMESNGSSSMASVCGGSLALMDAGVPVSTHAAGVAIGLVTKYSNNDTKHIEDYKLLTDILGIEDYLGDMDFKMAGTKKGVTAIQADVKIPGLPLKIVMEAVQQATDAKSAIIDIMAETIQQPRAEKKDNWPVVEVLEIPVHKRSRFIGLGGVNLKKLELETGVQITQDDDKFVVFAANQDVMNEAREMIDSLLKADVEPSLEFGGIYTAKIVELRDIGVMVSLFTNMAPVLLHNSQLDQRKINHPSALGLAVGQEIQVKYFGRDPVSGVMRLSRKVLQTMPSHVVRDFVNRDSTGSS